MNKSKPDQYKKSNIYPALNQAQNELIKDYSNKADQDYDKLHEIEPELIKEFDKSYSYPNDYLYNKSHTAEQSSRHTADNIAKQIPTPFLNEMNVSEAAELVVEEPKDISKIPPIWDINRPQPKLIQYLLHHRNEYIDTAAVLEIGCGSGENLFLFVKNRFRCCIGIDIESAAIDEAIKKAKARGYLALAGSVAFHKQDALQLEKFGRLFDIIIDAGFFHFLQSEEQRRIYRDGLNYTLKYQGELLLLVQSKEEPELTTEQKDLYEKLHIPPIARVSEDEIRSLFNAEEGWEILSVEPAHWEIRHHTPPGAKALFFRIKRTKKGPLEQSMAFKELQVHSIPK